MNVLQVKELKNISWLVGGRIAQMILSLFIGILTARYLGPSNYGLIGYATAYVAFFTSFCNLGINSVIIKNFVEYPNEQGEAIGTTIILRAISSLISILSILLIVLILDNKELLTIHVTFLCSLALLFQVFDTINYWFQSKYQSKIPTIATLIAYFVVSVYKVILLVLEKDVLWFAMSTSIDYFLIGAMLLISYKKHNGPKLSFSFSKTKQLLGKSYHYVLSGMMVAIYGQTDRVMLKQLLDESQVGYYTIAVTVCGMWVFILTAIIDSLYPTILQFHKRDKLLFEAKNRQLYSIVFYLSIIISIIFLLFGKWIIGILYGQDFMGAVAPLKIVTWYTAFSYLGVARNAWIVCEDKQVYLKYMYLGAAAINVLLNLIFIPNYGASGAAMASLITQVFTSLILPLCFKGMRPNVRLMIDAIMLKDVIRKIKQ